MWVIRSNEKSQGTKHVIFYFLIRKMCAVVIRLVWRNRGGRKEMLEHITASEVAGYGVGALLLCATISAPKIDSLISASQRSSLGMCKKCGDLRLIACSTCKGSGSIREGGSFNFSPVEDLSFGGKSKMRFLSCNKCQSRGHFCCPECSKIPQT